MINLMKEDIKKLALFTEATINTLIGTPYLYARAMAILLIVDFTRASSTGFRMIKYKHSQMQLVTWPYLIS